jgi:hypothetical protein
MCRVSLLDLTTSSVRDLFRFIGTGRDGLQCESLRWVRTGKHPTGRSFHLCIPMHGWKGRSVSITGRVRGLGQVCVAVVASRQHFFHVLVPGLVDGSAVRVRGLAGVVGWCVASWVARRVGLFRRSG